jgi:signal transduction histidine kinase
MKIRLGGLHLQLLGLIILPLSLALLAIAVAGIRIHQDAMRQLVAERDVRAVRAAADAISEQLHHRDAAIFGLSIRLEDGISPSTVIEQADFLYPDFDRGLVVFDDQGLSLAATVPQQEWERWKVALIINSLPEDQTIFSEPLIENDVGLILVSARGGDRIVMGAFSIDSLMRSAMLDTGSGPVGYRAFLTDREGDVLQSVGAELQMDNQMSHLGVEAALRGEVGASFIPAEDGEHIVAFSSVQPTGWALILEEPWEAVTSPVLDLSLAAPLVLVPALLVTLVGLWFGSRQVIGPIRKLQEQAEQLAQSNFTAIEQSVGGIGEIRSLQNTLAWMTKNILQAQSALQRYIGAITDAQEDERRRLARELHDETIQDLIVIDQHIQMIQMEQEDSPALEGMLANLRSEVGESIQELRRLIRALRPIYLDDLGLVPALEMLANETKEEHRLKILFSVDGAIQRLEPSAELAIYRIVQEGLSNSIRHAQAESITIRLQFLEDRFIVNLHDDGVGFSPPDRLRDLGAMGHFGLMGISERAELIGAQLELKSDPVTGTHIRIELPLRKADLEA